MGFFRLILAISVLIAHSAPIFGLNLVGGQTAVQVFYLISGFYMALILTTKYSHSIKTFYQNRLQKIYFTYWPILVLAIIFTLLTKNYFSQYFWQLPFITQFILLFSNIFIIGQDVLMFTGINISAGHLFFTPNFRLYVPEIYNFLFVNQTWSIALELYFYSLAPFLNKLKTKYLLLIILSSLAFRIFLISVSLYQDPWSYRLFPNEIALFITGMLLYRYRHLLSRFKLSVFLLVAFTLVYPFIPLNNSKILAYILLSAFTLPSLFNLSQNSHLDRYIGELSFPLYLVHQLVIEFLKLFITPDFFFSFKVLLVSLVTSVLLYRFLIKPLDSLRQQRLIKAV